jgi:restriction system protein
MKLKMAPNSLFAMLLRSPWWISFALAVVVALVARLVLPKTLELFAVFSAIPFVVIGSVAAWKQLRSPSAAKVADTLAALATLPWNPFADAMEQAFRRDGHEVTRLAGTAADFALAKAGRSTLVSCRRWKARRTGVEPLRELHAAMEAQDAAAGIHVTLGEPTEQAARFAAEHRIQILQGAALAAFLRGIPLVSRA